MATPPNKSKVATQHPEYTAMLSQWQKGIDCTSGQRPIHNAGVTYLPKLKDQSDEDYNAFKLRALYTNYSGRSVTGYVGMMFRKPMIILPDSEPIKELLKDVTMSGVSFNTLAQESTDEVMTTGRDGIMVDFPVDGTEGMTVAMAEAAGIRPIMARYPAISIINWKTMRIGNATVLSMVVLQESAEIPSKENEFAHDTEKRYRVLDLVKRFKVIDNKNTGEWERVYRQRVFKVDKNTGEDVQIGGDIFPLMNNKPLERIPFYFIGAEDTTPKVNEPPLIDLFDVNLDHYRLSADLKHGLHFTIPTPWVAGYTPENLGDKFQIGSSHAWLFPDPDTKVGYLEFKGEGLKPVSDEMIKDEERMAILSSRLLSAEKKDSETAQTAQIHRSGENSILSMIAQTISAGLTQALNTFCEWAGQPGKWSVEINTDFVPPEVTSEELTGWMNAWLSGAPGFSDQEFFERLHRNEMITPGLTLEEEQARIGDKGLNRPDLGE